MPPYLVDDDVPPALAGGSQHLLQTPGGLLHHLLPLALVMVLPRLTIDLHNTQLKFNKVLIMETGDTLHHSTHRHLVDHGAGADHIVLLVRVLCHVLRHPEL